MSSHQRDDLRPEYPPELIRSGERGKYAAEHYPDAEAVDRALREHLAEHSGEAA